MIGYQAGLGVQLTADSSTCSCGGRGTTENEATEAGVTVGGFCEELRGGGRDGPRLRSRNLNKIGVSRNRSLSKSWIKNSFISYSLLYLYTVGFQKCG